MKISKICIETIRKDFDKQLSLEDKKKVKTVGYKVPDTQLDLFSPNGQLLIPFPENKNTIK